MADSCKTCKGKGTIVIEERRKTGNPFFNRSTITAPCPDCQPPKPTK